MNPFNQDLFEQWRLLLALACTVYATLVTLKSLWGWMVYFSAPDRPTSVLRRYAIVQLLRLRFGRFAWELLQIGFWLTIALVLLTLHV